MLCIVWVLVFCCAKFHKNLFEEFRDILAIFPPLTKKRTLLLFHLPCMALTKKEQPLMVYSTGLLLINNLATLDFIMTKIYFHFLALHIWMVCTKRHLEDKMDAQASLPFPCCGGDVLWTGLGWFSVERKTNWMCVKIGKSQV